MANFHDSEFSAYLTTAEAWIVVIDDAKTVVRASQAVRRLLGHCPLQRPIEEILCSDREQSLPNEGGFLQWLGEAIQACQRSSNESPLSATRKSVAFDILNESTAIPFRGTAVCTTVAGRFRCFVTLNNAQAQRRRETQLERLAATDPLTGLPNRRAFQDALESGIGQPLAVAIFDVDRFKQINDLHGHPAGDDTLLQIGQVIAESFPEHTVARLGGDEFGVVLALADCGSIDSQNVTSVLQSAVQQTLQRTERVTANGGTTITISAGVAIDENAGSQARDLLSVADRALYESKANGRNRVTIKSLTA